MKRLLVKLRRKLARRRHRQDAREQHVRERTAAILRQVAQPLVEAGLARLEWEPNADEVERQGAWDLIPVNPAAAQVRVWPEPYIVTLNVGPDLSGHEILTQKSWEGSLRGCLEAIVEGRYTESTEPGRLSKLTMTFEITDDADVVVVHFGLGGAAEAPRRRQFAGYADRTCH